MEKENRKPDTVEKLKLAAKEKMAEAEEREPESEIVTPDYVTMYKSMVELMEHQIQTSDLPNGDKKTLSVYLNAINEIARPAVNRMYSETKD